MIKKMRIFSAFSITFFSVALLVLVCSLMTFNYVIQPVLSAGKVQWVERVLSSSLKQPVTIRQLSTQWQGLQPIINVEDFSILDAKHTSTLLSIKHVCVGIDLLATLMKWKIMPGNLRLEGMHLIFKESADGKLDINAIPFLQSDLYAQDFTKLNYVFDCFLTQGTKVLNDVAVTWYNPNGQVVLAIAKLAFSEQSHFWSRSFQGSAVIWDQSPVVFKGRAYGSYLAKRLLSTDTHVALDRIQLQQYALLNRFTHPIRLKAGQGTLALDVMTRPQQATRLKGTFSGARLQLEAGNKIYAFPTLTTQFYLACRSNSCSVLFKRLNFLYPAMFAQPLSAEKVAAQFNWRKEATNRLFKIKNVVLNLKFMQAQGHINLALPNENESAKIDSMFHFTVQDTAQLSKLYPISMPPALSKWLREALQGGHLDKGLVVLKGALKEFPFDQGEGKLLISANLDQGRIHYLSGWPDIVDLRAQLLFEGRSLTIISDHALMLGANLPYLEAKINNLREPVLYLKGQLNTMPNQVITVDKASNPLLNHLQWLALNPLTLRGKWQLGLNLTLPLSKAVGTTPKFAGRLNLADAMIATKQVCLKHLTGSLLFREDTVETPLLTGKIASRPFRLTSASQVNASGKTTQMTMTGIVDVLELEQLAKVHLANYLTGSTSYKAILTMFKPLTGRVEKSLVVESALQGIESHLPPPFAKSANSSLPSHFQLEERGAMRQVTLNYGAGVNAVLAYKLHNAHPLFERGTIQLNNQKAELPPGQGLKLAGNLKQFNWAAWRALFSHYTHGSERWSGQAKRLHALVNQVNLTVDQLQVAGLTIQKALVKMNRRPDALVLFIDSAIAYGEVELPKAFPLAPIKVVLQSLQLPKRHVLESKSSPRDIPPLDIKIFNFQYKDRSIKNLELMVRPMGSDLIIKRVSMQEPSFEVAASGIWRESNGQEETVLSGDFKSNNLGAVLSRWQLTQNVARGKGHARFKLSWQNSPFNPEAKSLTGMMELYFARGKIIKLGSEANFGMGIGRVLTLFSLQTLPRRLVLDFSDLTEAGFSFDEMKGTLQFKQGNIFTDRASLDGPVAKVRIKGRIGLVAKDYNVRLTINPYVTSSLPVVATLTAGPIAGAVTWLVDKVISRQVKKITEIHYTVTGSWDNPDLHNLTAPEN